MHTLCYNTEEFVYSIALIARFLTLVFFLNGRAIENRCMTLLRILGAEQHEHNKTQRKLPRKRKKCLRSKKY